VRATRRECAFLSGAVFGKICEGFGANRAAEAPESFYNQARRRSHIGGVSPEQFESAAR